VKKTKGIISTKVMSEESRVTPFGEVLVNQSDVKLIEDGEGVGWVVFDKDGRSANMFDETLSVQLRSTLSRVESEIEKKRIRVVVFWSMKKSFIVGADIETIRHLHSEPGTNHSYPLVSQPCHDSNELCFLSSHMCNV
jgi:enoyl-CoA hydratase/carnithine racemase